MPPFIESQCLAINNTHTHIQTTHTYKHTHTHTQKHRHTLEKEIHRETYRHIYNHIYTYTTQIHRGTHVHNTDTQIYTQQHTCTYTCPCSEHPDREQALIKPPSKKNVMRKCWIGSKGKDEEPRFGCENSWTQGMYSMGRISKDLGEKNRPLCIRLITAGTKSLRLPPGLQPECTQRMQSKVQLMSWLLQHSQEI